MGAAPRSSPALVAKEFTRVYYNLVAKIPSRLSELYGDSSELNHGPSFRATGRQEIFSLSKKLPLSNSSATVDSVIHQASANGNVIIVVRGTYGTSSVPFSQTFLLAKQSDSHDDHFYCCNDVFVPMSPGSFGETSTSQHEPLIELVNPSKSTGPVPDATPSNLHSADTEPQHDNGERRSNDGADIQRERNSRPSEAVTTISSEDLETRSAPVSQKLPVSAPVTALSQSPTVNAQDRNTSSNELSVALPAQSAVSNRSLQPPAPMSVATQPSQNRPSMTPQPEAPTAVTVASGVTDDASAIGDDEQQSSIHTPARKTWAAIVSPKDDLSVLNNTQSKNSGMPPAPGATSPAPVASGTEPPSAASSPDSLPTAPIAESSTVPTARTRSPNHSIAEMPKENTVAMTQNSNPDKNTFNNMHPMGRNSHLNGRPMHAGRGGPRNFGPSAVVTLASLGMPVSDVRSLTNNLREEFSKYGHKLRGVEVKASKGIAFIEYDSADGVRAAVDAWAHGPRKEGNFAGIALHVTEKRISHTGRRPGSMRGSGRGGPRGGARRSRPPSAPLG